MLKDNNCNININKRVIFLSFFNLSLFNHIILNSHLILEYEFNIECKTIPITLSLHAQYTDTSKYTYDIGNSITTSQVVIGK